MEILSNINELEEKDMDGQGRKTSIVFIIIISLISAMVGSFMTAFVLGNRVENSTAKQNIIVNEEGKSQNVYHAVTEKAMPSVVGITTTTINRNNYFAIPQESQGVGTGFIVKSNGYILTNSHVVSDGQAADVNVLFNDGTNMKGKVLWNDASLDLAVVKVEKTGLVEADLGDSDKVRIGDIAIAIGNPLGFEFQRTVTSGIVSGKNRSINLNGTYMEDLIQTDASINSGNSGGPLINKNGEVIGINTIKVESAEGIGFAIPVNQIKPILEKIKETGEFREVYLGIRGYDKEMISSIDSTIRLKKGIYVYEVERNSPAEKAGIEENDIILSIQNEEIETMCGLREVLYSKNVGEVVNMTLIRNSIPLSINVKLEEK
jgi:S1-C subfamily serine protease